VLFSEVGMEESRCGREISMMEIERRYALMFSIKLEVSLTDIRIPLDSSS
jgi:hypothetical protein